LESKFDLAAARHHAYTGGLMNTTIWLHAALDEIERLQERIQEIEGWLVEETAKAFALSDGHKWCDLADFPSTAQYYKDEASVILRARGKIGGEHVAHDVLRGMLEEAKRDA